MRKTLIAAIASLMLALTATAANAGGRPPYDPCSGNQDHVLIGGPQSDGWAAYEGSCGVTFPDPAARAYVTMLEHTISFQIFVARDLSTTVDTQSAKIARQHQKIVKLRHDLRSARHHG